MNSNGYLEQVQAMAWALYLQRQHIKLVCWDFDGTIMSNFGLIHGIPLPTQKNVRNLKTDLEYWASQVSHYFVWMFYALEYLGIQQTIVTHNQASVNSIKGEPLIRGILQYVIGYDRAHSIPIFAVHTKDKLYHLQESRNWIMKTFKINVLPSETMLVDDYQTNLNVAVQHGYSIWAVQNTTTTIGFRFPPIP